MYTMDDFNDAIDNLSNALVPIKTALENFAEAIKSLFNLAVDTEESLPPQKYAARQRKDALFHRPAVKIYKADLNRIKKHQPYSRRIF